MPTPQPPMMSPGVAGATNAPPGNESPEPTLVREWRVCEYADGSFAVKGPTGEQKVASLEEAADVLESMAEGGEGDEAAAFEAGAQAASPGMSDRMGAY